ncbi:MAG: ABC transporter permease [Acidobacteriota bacterium]
MPAFWQDLKFSVRLMMKSPGFTLAAAVTLALGIGANTALYSVVDAVLVQPLPYADPGRVVALWETQTGAGQTRWRMTPADYLDVKAQNRVFEGVAAFTASGAILTGEGEPEQLLGSRVAGEYFQVLGIRPAIGRFFGPEACRPGAEPVAVLGYGLWQRRFGGTAAILGRRMSLDGESYTVVGIMPPGVYPTWPMTIARFTFQPSHQQYWIPLQTDAAWAANRRSHVLGVVARLAAGVRLEQARDHINVIAGRIAAEIPEKKGEGLEVRPLAGEAVGNVRPALLVLLAAAGVVLLIACANVSGLLLARLATRGREIALRAALGAGRGRLASQFLVEGVVLGLLGCGLGLWLASLGMDVVLRLIPQEIPRLSEVGINGRVLAFSLGVTLLAVLLYALVPVVQFARPELAQALNASGRGIFSGGRHRLRSGMVVAQVAMAVLLVTAAGLLTLSFWRLSQVDPGFRSRSVLIAELNLPPTKYRSWDQVVSFYDRLLEKARALPGVEAAAIAYDHPLQTAWLDGFAIEGEAAPNPDLAYSEAFRPVSAGFFRALGIDLIRGRTFTDRDGIGRPGIVIINQAFARTYFPDSDPMGRSLRIGTPRRYWGDPAPESFEIVGIVRDIRARGLALAAEPAFYIPASQFPLQSMSLFLSTGGSPVNLGTAVRSAVLSLDGAQPVTRVETIEQVLDGQVARPRFNVILMGLFSLLSLALVLVGIYGLLACLVANSTREIGLRLALGASPGRLLLRVAGRGLGLVGAGIAIGLPAAAALMRFLSSELYGVASTDPVVFILVPALIASIAFIACWYPARRAARVDPMTALRAE